MHSRLFWLLVGLAILARSAIGCPACNIYNYLGESIRSSRNIVTGKVIETSGNWDVRLEVVSVLRGGHKPGEVVTMKRDGQLENGKVCIFSDPEPFGPTYPCLTMDYEEEVRFLLGFGADMVSHPEPSLPQPGKPVIRDLDQAIRCIQYTSNEARGLAGEYIAALATHPTARLISEIRNQRERATSTHIRPVACLVDALMLKHTAQADQFALAEMRSLLEQQEETIDWDHTPESPSLRGEYMRVLVGCTNPEFNPLLLGYRAGPKRATNPALRAQLCELALAVLPRLGTRALADVTYGLCSDRAVTPKRLSQALADRGTDGVALGMYLIGRREAYVWSTQAAQSAFSHAAGLAGEPRLKAEIQSAADRLSKAKFNEAGRSTAADYYDQVAVLPQPPRARLAISRPILIGAFAGATGLGLLLVRRHKRASARCAHD